MSESRRSILRSSLAGLVGWTGLVKAEPIDGVGPNRGIASRTLRGKQTCVNDAVPRSDAVGRLSMPGDFRGDGCTMVADSHEGPFFTCAPAVGRQIAVGRPGQALTVAFRLIDSSCRPIPGGVVDTWACDAHGNYSGYSYNPDETPPMVRAILFGHVKPDRDERFCRGALVTDEQGIAEFDTVYPGFYSGVPIHIHFKAHVHGKNLLTSQANLPESWNERIMNMAPYNRPRPISRDRSETGFPKMRIVERAGRLLAVLDLVVPA